MHLLDDFYRKLPEGRCKNCEFVKAVTASGGMIFLGCFHNPYKGKWVREIKECPKNVEKNE